MIKKIYDANGGEMRGLYRGNLGAIVVNDSDAFNQYQMLVQHKQESTKKIQQLEQELKDLRLLVERLVK